MSKNVIGERIGMAIGRGETPYIHKIINAEGKKIGYQCMSIKVKTKAILKAELKKLNMTTSYFGYSFGTYTL